VPMYAENVAKGEKVLDELQGQLNAKDAELKKATTEEEKKRLQADIKRLTGNMQTTYKAYLENSHPLQMLANNAIVTLAQYGLDPEKFVEEMKKREAEGGGADGVPPGGDGGDGGDIPPDDGDGGGPRRGRDTLPNGEPNWFRRDPPGRSALPGIFS